MSRQGRLQEFQAPAVASAPSFSSSVGFSISAASLPAASVASASNIITTKERRFKVVFYRTQIKCNRARVSRAIEAVHYGVTGSLIPTRFGQHERYYATPCDWKVRGSMVHSPPESPTAYMRRHTPNSIPPQASSHRQRHLMNFKSTTFSYPSFNPAYCIQHFTSL